MHLTTFQQWVEKKQAVPLVSESDKLMQVIKQAGSAGINDVELRSRIKLQRKIVDEILKGLIELNLITATGSYGERFYRVTNSPAAKIL